VGPSCLYVDAEPFSWKCFAGIPRYTARLALALSSRLPVRFFSEGKELLPPRHLGWSQDQDLANWARRIWRGRRERLGTPPPDCIAVYGSKRPAERRFPYEVSILHDFCPVVVPWAFPDNEREGFVKFLTRDILAADLVIAVSHSTESDAIRFSPLDPGRIIVVSSGPSLCVETHRHPARVERSDRIGLVVSTIEPRKNAPFLFDWFQRSTVLPPAMELWWVGKLGWMTSRSQLRRMAHPAGGRRVRLLGNVTDAQLCRLYRKAGWSIYPSHYEGFGFPILDSLRHGTPVLSSRTSSMGEFDHPGVFFFDPNDPATVDLAWQRFQGSQASTISRDRLDGLYNWDNVARAILDVYARARGSRLRLTAIGRDERQPLLGPATVSPRDGSRSAEQQTGMRIGIEMFGTQTFGDQTSEGRYACGLVAALLSRNTDHHYVLYVRDGLPTDELPAAPHAVVHLLRPDASRGETTLTHIIDRLAVTNPDGLDLLVLLSPLERAPGFDLPPKPLSGLKMVAVVRDLLPLMFQDDGLSSPEAADRWRRYRRGLDRLRGYDALLVISEATRCDLTSLLGLPGDRVAAIGPASDVRLFVPDRAEPMTVESSAALLGLGITRPFVFSTGSVEYHDNLWVLIDAFAMLPFECRQRLQLVLGYSLSGADRDRVREYARNRGVLDHVVITGTVADSTQRILYQRCAAFVSTATHDGFNLPVLEAMLCAAVVIACDRSPQSEIAGDAGLHYDSASASELASQLLCTLEKSDRVSALRNRAVLWARDVRWEETADRVLQGLNRALDRQPPRRSHTERRHFPRNRIAFFSPLPPLRTSISEHSVRLLDELKQRYMIDVYHDDGYLPYVAFQALDIGCFDYRLFERRVTVMGYHAILYQMGNSRYLDYMYGILMHNPGIVTLHAPHLATPAGRMLERATAVIALDAFEGGEALRQTADWYHVGGEFGWPRLADLYEEIIERTVAARCRLPADPISNLQELQLPGSAQWLQPES
jgi:glycosyltransferase involved in cell wall biosynthesis